MKVHIVENLVAWSLK